MSKATVKKADKRGPGRPKKIVAEFVGEKKVPEGQRAVTGAARSMAALEIEVNNLLAKVSPILGPAPEETPEKSFKPNPEGCGMSNAFDAIQFAADSLRRRIHATSARVQF